MQPAYVAPAPVQYIMQPPQPQINPMVQYIPNVQNPLDAYQMQADLHRMQQEKHDNEEFKEIYNYIKKKEKKKYKDKINKLVKQVREANQATLEAKALPRQRTVKLQTRNPIAFVNRGLDPIKFEKEDKEIPAQPEFRQESVERAISEKLDEIEKKAIEQSRKKKTFQRFHHKPPGNFIKHVSKFEYKNSVI